VTMSLGRNSVLNLMGAIVPLLVGAVSVPYLLAQLGVERFGVLTLLWVIIGYFSLFDLGMGRAVTQQVASLLGGNREHEIRKVVAISTLLTLATGLLGAGLLAAFAGFIASSGLGLSATLVGETETCLLIAALGVPLATLSASWRGILEGYNRFFAANLTKTGFGVAIFGLPALGVMLVGADLRVVTWCLVLARLLSALAFWLLSTRLPFHALGSMQFNRREALDLLKFGAWMGASNLVSPLLVYVDRFVIAKVLGAALVAYYTVPFEFIVRILIIPGAIGAALLPQLAITFTQSPDQARLLMTRALRLTAVLMLVCSFVGAVLAYPLMSRFINPDFANHAQWVAIILCFGVFFNGVANVPYSALHALGAARQTGLLHLLELLLYLPMLYILVLKLGVIGAAIAWAVRTAADCFTQTFMIRCILRARRV